MVAKFFIIATNKHFLRLLFRQVFLLGDEWLKEEHTNSDKRSSAIITVCYGIVVHVYSVICSAEVTIS